MTPPDFEHKIVAAADLPSRVAHLPRPIVFTNGVFDILHRGHVTYLARARALGASLVVAVGFASLPFTIDAIRARAALGRAGRAAR